ncbi:response regulator transcription factor [Paraconexibacter antarcticus]|uniref:Response regulator transcription factor n=1 Tax=Paraconexibacter antarcticus TaxID=2949664 RepID=A0ABY5DW61_9ACTN|nr:response regulator transcription factor [Paraconexibacter antarcticus]UTI66258.1 response regulator transcription factor [Paraconexibacter antarcticus]
MTKTQAPNGLATIDCVVADDHEMLQRGLVQLLEAEDDIRVTGRASTLAQARRLTESRKPQVLVVDMQMPDGSGIDLCETLRGSATKVLLYSAHDKADLVEAALEAGALGYVLKSGPPQVIVQAVRLVNDGGHYIDAVLAPKLLRRSQERRAVLSFREREVLQLLSQGSTTGEAALHLHLSPATIRSYAENAMSKLGVGNRTHAVAQALRRDLIS